MSPQAVDEALSREPFVPVRLWTSDGRGYAVRRPNLTFVFRGTLYLARANRPTRIADEMDAVACERVTRVEPIGEPEATPPVPARP